ncbi:hypothetical protein PGT21_023732 [Puccinia graminis f. sp. tritici]|uniref:Uncharacterized protein n=1 Tax=Puccinia graminis f. sp. tritici TaxID=56615 RepID=A0A5B0QYG8_PUCGR|nr:hypothetical protein PGT21_023732 [Puccinia graminis f. sp. tritici]
MRFFSRMLAPSRDQSAPPKHSQVAPPTLHHHLQRPTRILRSPNLEIQDLLAAEPARVSLTPLPYDANGLKLVSRIALKWKSRFGQSPGPVPTASQSDLGHGCPLQPTLTQQSSPDQRAKLRRHSHLPPGPRMTGAKSFSDARPLRDLSPAAPPLKPKTSSIFGAKKKGISQISRPRLLTEDPWNTQISLHRSPSQHRRNIPVDMDFACFSPSNPQDISIDSNDYAASTLDLLHFYREVHGYSPASSSLGASCSPRLGIQ